jgi:hypothetical protein
VQRSKPSKSNEAYAFLIILLPRRAGIARAVQWLAIPATNRGALCSSTAINDKEAKNNEMAELSTLALGRF